MRSPFLGPALLVALPIAFAALAACGGELVDKAPIGGSSAGGGDQGGGNQGGGNGGVDVACDPLVPSYCGFPFPSNVYTVSDDATPTGLRVAFPAKALPITESGREQDPTPWSKADGFSPGSAIVTYFPDAAPDGLVSVLDLEASLDDAALTVVLDTATGERVPHWSELDKSTDVDEQRSLLIHPAVPLTDATRYIVAIRGLVDTNGNAIEPSPAFKALRDDEESDEPSVGARRDLYADIFDKLGEAGVERSDLLLAWDFTTASRESNTGWLVHMRDQALELAGPTGPAYTITGVDSDIDPTNIEYRIFGTMTVPLYLTQPDPGAALVFGDDGMPMQNPDTPTYEVEWELLIPKSATPGQPVPLLQYGHGLLGSYTQIESEKMRQLAQTYGYAVFAVKADGMAEEDEGWIAARISSGEADELQKMFDRLHQGILNNLLAMRMMSVGMDADPTYGALIDGSRRYYWGISQGGIMGGVYMSLSTDVSRGILEVGGQPYNVLLNRSVDFTPFFALLKFEFPDARAQQIFLGLTQMNWDRVEPQGYTKYMFEDQFSDAPADRRVLMRVAVGDHQVTTFGGQIMARAANAKHLDTGIRDVYGLEKVTAQSIDENGAVYTEYEFGLPPEPTCNKPLSVCEDPHGELRGLTEAIEQLHLFFSTGVFENRCAGQVCDFSALSGCTGEEDPDPCD
ncbi:MAG: hypothetical protein HOW73_12865 [Polyangiaceae bacterium]|nr:hypothetical protein [Polyangiaceae bacterium]